jgi:aspartyl protease family protein
MKRRGALAAAGALFWAGPAHANQVVLAGRMGDKALLVVNGRPHALAVGESAAGVRLVRWHDDLAEIDAGAGVVKLRIGGAPALLSGTQRANTAREIVIPAAGGGHFLAQGAINGQAVQFMVDTGATLVALGQADAARLGVDLSRAQTAVTQTANGPVPTRLVTLTRVRVGEIELANVGAAVLPMTMPYVLLGNSFLSRFQMRRDNDVMRLELR